MCNLQLRMERRNSITLQECLSKPLLQLKEPLKVLSAHQRHPLKSHTFPSPPASCTPEKKPFKFFMIDINNKKSGETLYNVLLSAATTKTAQRENLYFMKLAREHNTENTEKTKTFKKIFAPFPTDFIESAQRFVCMLFMAQKIFIYFAHRHFTIPNRKKGRRVERKV